MNKQELIEKIKKLPFVLLSERYISQNYVLELLEQLDEPEKVKVPQFVADWIETAKKAAYNIRGAIDLAPKGKVKDWLELKNVNTFAKAWVNGYEVEKEKRYLVKVKGVNEECEYLVFGKLSDTWKFRSLGSFEELKKHHTRKELEDAGFGWVFDCPGMEVEEVEE